MWFLPSAGRSLTIWSGSTGGGGRKAYTGMALRSCVILTRGIERERMHMIMKTAQCRDSREEFLYCGCVGAFAFHPREMRSDKHRPCTEVWIYSVSSQLIPGVRGPKA